MGSFIKQIVVNNGIITGATTGQVNLASDVTGTLGAASIGTHANNHQSGGSDVIALDTLGTPSDNGNLNATSGRHGLLPKLSGVSGEYLNGTGNWALVTGVTPSAHASSHQSGGSDPIALDTLGVPSDITFLNATSGRHGLLPKLSGVSGEYLNGTGNWALVTGVTPSAHASSHKSGGSDVIKLDELGTPDDNTSCNSTTGRHGLLRKLSGVSSEYLNGSGNWAVVTGVTPSAHASSHQSGGSDVIALDTLGACSDNSNLNSTTGSHGLLRKLSGTSTEYLNGAGNWATVTATATLPAGHIFGLILSNNSTDPTNDIDITAGKCRSVDDTEDIVLASAITKRLDAAWAVGTNQGGLDTGSIANTWYTVWAIKRTDTGVVDVLFSTSNTSPTMPTNYTKKRRIGWILRAGGAIKPFYQYEDDFKWITPVVDVNALNPGTAAVLRTMTVPSFAEWNGSISFTGNTPATDNPAGINIQDPVEVDYGPTAGLATFFVYLNVNNVAVPFRCRTNAFSQLRTRCQLSGAATSLYLFTMGWNDSRGRLS
jgi:hypothetical protein